LIHIEGTPPIDYGYDANGNITSETGWTYVYDLSNQLIRVLQNSNQVAEYTYNGAGQRIKKVTQTETRIFHYDLLGHLIAETNQSGQMLAEYIYLGDQLLVVIKPGESAYYFHNDHLGTPQVLTDGNGNIVWKAVYTPFGEAVASIQTVENPFRFPGQYYDSETGLHYNYFRYYNPQTGRYITPDPIGLEGWINLFAYVNNPINWTDPLGLLGPFGPGFKNVRWPDPNPYAPGPDTTFEDPKWVRMISPCPTGGKAILGQFSSTAAAIGLVGGAKMGWDFYRSLIWVIRARIFGTPIPIYVPVPLEKPGET
jgi:RHS repeat-associated protein